MMKTVKTSKVLRTGELTGAALDWAVAKCEGVTEHSMGHWKISILEACTAFQYSPSTDWAQGGPIIEKMKSYCQEKDEETGECYCATPSVAEEWHDHPVKARGSTPLIAAMRCYVASKLGDTIEVPEELI